MDDKLLQQVGHFIGQTRAEVLTLTEDKLEKAVELVRTDIIDKHGVVLDYVQELNNKLADDLNDTLKGATTEHVEQIALMTEQLKAQEVFEAQLTQRIAEIKDGEKGEQGVQGDDGEDGLDRPLVEPVELVAQKDYPKSTIGTFDGGLWIATKETVGSPSDDPQAWHCMLDAMTTMSIDLLEDRKFKLSVRMSSGEQLEDTFAIPYPEHKGIWEEGSYLKGDIVTKGHSMWLAQEDTSGQPPGNGWQQILSAPRGKQGLEGKSIVGPQGKPGRNGADAILPENFIDDVMALAGERRAFEDGRSAAEAITSFRGYFQSDETYAAGDVVNDSGSLLVCISGGRFSSIAAGKDSWELMLNVPQFMMPAFMDYQGAWVQKAYKGGDVVRDGGWTMVAVRNTEDRAAPQEVGSDFYPYQGTMSNFQNSAKHVIYGQRFLNNEKPFFIKGYKLDIIAGQTYEVYIVKDIFIEPTYTLINAVFADTTETQEYSVSPTLFPIDSAFDLVVIVFEADLTPVEWTGNWDYNTPNNARDPLPGEVVQANRLAQSLRVHIIDDDAVDRRTELVALTVGDRILMGGLEWQIAGITDNTTWFDFDVLPPQLSSPDGVSLFTFETVTETPIDIGRDVGYWALDTSIFGLISIDGGYSDITVDDNAYGIIDVKLVEAYHSADWDVVSSGGEPVTQVGVSARQLTEQQVNWVKSSSSPLKSAEVVTSGNSWTELARISLDADTAIKATFSVDAKRTDDVEYHVSEWVALAWNEAGNLTSYLQKDMEVGADLSVSLDTDGQDLLIRVRGKPGQDWDWKITAYYRELH